MALYGFFRANFTPKCMHNLTSIEIVLSNKTYKISKIDLSVEVLDSIVNWKNKFKGQSLYYRIGKQIYYTNSGKRDDS